MRIPSQEIIESPTEQVFFGFQLFPTKVNIGELLQVCELEALTHLFVIGVMFPFDTPKSFRVVSNFGTQCGMWTPSGKVTLEFKADGTWICKDTELSGNWKLTSQHLLDFEKHGLRTLYKPLLGTESFVQIEGDDDRLEIFIPETDHQSVSFRLYRGPIEENQKYPPIFLWKCNDKCVCTQFGTITGKPHGSWKYRENDILEASFHFSCQEQSAHMHTFEPIAGTSSLRLFHEHRKVLLIPTCAQAMHKLGFDNQLCLSVQSDMSVFDEPIRHWKSFHLCEATTMNVSATLDLFVDGRVQCRTNDFPCQGNWVCLPRVLS